MPAAAPTFEAWLNDTAAGRYLRDWQQQHYDQVVQDIFGYYALHIGTGAIEALRSSRIQHPWRMQSVPLQGDGDAGAAEAPALVAAPQALPFGPDQFDLIVLPHALEIGPHPHAALREATRVLRPEGRLIISGFNPGRLALHLRPHLPRAVLGDAIGYWRLRDWLHLLGFEVEQSHFGCAIPRFQNPRWYERLRWLDRLTHERLPLLGSAYFVVATKKVHGARLLGPAIPALATAPRLAPCSARARR